MNRKVLLHYNKTSGYIQQIDILVDQCQRLEVADNDGNVKIILPEDAKGTRASLPLTFDSDGFNLDFVRMGYALTHKKDPAKGRLVKLPKKETKLRELFGITNPKKASIRTHDYDNIDLGVIDNDKDRLSLLRGIFSAKAKIVPGTKGYIVLNWDKLDLNNDEFLGMVRNMTSATLEYNSSNIFFQSRTQLYEYITKIGFVQKSKMESIITSYRLHLRIINDIIYISNNDYLFYHISNFDSPKDYNDELALNYDINAIDKKTGKPLLLYSLENAKHSSYYPALWLLEHGVTTGFVYKGRSFKDIVDESLICESNYEYIIRICVYIYPMEYTKKIINYNHIDLILAALPNLDKNLILSEIIGTDFIHIYNIDYTKYDKNLVKFEKIVEHSSEDLNNIMNKVLDKINNVLFLGEKKHESIMNSGYSYYPILDTLMPIYDVLKHKVDLSNYNGKLGKIQNKMNEDKILIYRGKKPEKFI